MAVVPLHLGALHPVEHVLTLLLAFGPFVVLALAVRHARRRDAASAGESLADSTGDSTGDSTSGA